MAAAWGNKKFRAPTPFQAVILATRLHDIGWLAWDTAPRLGGDGRPVNFIGTTLAETAPIWRRALKHVSLLDPYAALLVSMHASTIYRRRLERGADPPEERSELETLAAEQASAQEKFRDALAGHPLYGPEVEPEKLITAYRWLRVCDLLSLSLCADVMALSGFIEAYQGRDSKEIVQIHYKRPRPFEARLDPWPFVERKIELVVQTRNLRPDTFSSQAAYLVELQKAPWTPQKVIISRE